VSVVTELSVLWSCPIIKVVVMLLDERLQVGMQMM
jgi:hypothetical protein